MVHQIYWKDYPHVSGGWPRRGDWYNKNYVGTRRPPVRVEPFDKKIARRCRRSGHSAARGSKSSTKMVISLHRSDIECLPFQENRVTGDNG